MPALELTCEVNVNTVPAVAELEEGVRETFVRFAVTVIGDAAEVLGNKIAAT